MTHCDVCGVSWAVHGTLCPQVPAEQMEVNRLRAQVDGLVKQLARREAFEPPPVQLSADAVLLAERDAARADVARLRALLKEITDAEDNTHATYGTDAHSDAVQRLVAALAAARKELEGDHGL